MSNANAGQRYLLVLGAGAARLLSLPPRGAYALRPAADGLALTDEADPAAWVRLLLDEGVCTVAAVPGAPPLALDGTPLSAAARLRSGAELCWGDLRAVLHADAPAAPGPRLLDAAEIDQRLRQEVDRARRYQRPLTVLVIEVGEDAAAAAGDRIAVAVRTSDLVGRSGPGELCVVLPEAGGAPEAPARRLMALLAADHPFARGGVAVHPQDGADADALVVGARAAARGTAPGTASRVAEAAFQVGDEAVVAVDPKMRLVYGLVRSLAASDLPVLVTGETGAGKEAVARALHAWSPRAAGPLVVVNCGAIPDSLLEGELFGHERGAFSGADRARAGLIESADGGTLFLDEVGECSLRAQAGLLRVLDRGAVRRVGAAQERPVAVRVVAATNRDLAGAVAEGTFRQDLFYRLNAAHVVVPPLRDRPLDLPALARRFLDDACTGLGRGVPALADDALRALQAHGWPGNVRELRNLMRYLAAVVGPAIGADDLPPTIGHRGPECPAAPASFRPIADEIRELERTRMAQALAAADGVQVRAAELIGMPLRTFAGKLKLYGLNASRGPGAASPGAA